jgi:hypothetical protein
MDAVTCVFLLDVVTLGLLWYLYLDQLVSNDAGRSNARFHHIAAPVTFAYWMASSPFRGDYIIMGNLFAGYWGLAAVLGPIRKCKC